MQWEKQLQKKYDCCRNEDMSSKRLTDQQRKFIHSEINHVLQTLACGECQSLCLLGNGGEKPMLPLQGKNQSISAPPVPLEHK